MATNQEKDIVGLQVTDQQKRNQKCSDHKGVYSQTYSALLFLFLGIIIKRATSIKINLPNSGIHHCSEPKLEAMKFGLGTIFAKK